MKKLTRSLQIAVLGLILVLGFAGCSGKQNGIVGKWKTSEGTNSETITFTKDGKVVNDSGNKAENGEYSLSTSNTLILKAEGTAMEFSVSFTSPDEMNLTPVKMNGMAMPGGQVPVAKFTRVSQ